VTLPLPPFLQHQQPKNVLNPDTTRNYISVDDGDYFMVNITANKEAMGYAESECKFAAVLWLDGKRFNSVKYFNSERPFTFKGFLTKNA
jgi:hypothetical protein